MFIPCDLESVIKDGGGGILIIFIFNIILSLRVTLENSIPTTNCREKKMSNLTENNARS